MERTCAWREGKQRARSNLTFSRFGVCESQGDVRMRASAQLDADAR